MPSMEKEEWKKKRVGVLMGGMSAEREVSFSSGRAILEALHQLGYEACTVEADKKLPSRLREKKIAVAFIGLHGRLGEDGAVQGLLETMRIPYTGSGILASALAMNKGVSRKIFMQNHLPVPKCVVLTPKDTFSLESLPFPLPIVIKPSQEGSSVGVVIVHEEKEISPALQKAFAYGSEILVEEYIKGREISVGVLDDVALGAIEIVPKVQFYSYEAKYRDGLTEHIFPASLPQADYDRALAVGLQAHRVLGCEGATRVDMIYTEPSSGPGQVYLLEVNSLPGMTALSLLPEIAKGVGINFPGLVERILWGARLKIPVHRPET